MISSIPAVNPLPGTMPLAKNFDFAKPPVTGKSTRKKIGMAIVVFILVMIVVIISISFIGKTERDNRGQTEETKASITPSPTPTSIPTPSVALKEDCFTTCSDFEFLEFAKTKISELDSYKALGTEQTEDFFGNTTAFFEKGFSYKEVDGNYGDNHSKQKIYSDTQYSYIINQNYTGSVLQSTTYDRKPNEIDMNNFFKATLDFLFNTYGSSVKPGNVIEAKTSVTELLNGEDARKFHVITQEGTAHEEQTISDFWFNSGGLLIREKDDAGILNGVYTTHYTDFNKLFSVQATHQKIKAEVEANTP